MGFSRMRLGSVRAIGTSDEVDRRLLREARGGSREAIDELVDRHWDRAHRIAFGILGDAHAAEDVTQEAMLSVVENIGRFDPYRAFPPWLHTIVTNRAIDFSRARNRQAEELASPLPVEGGISALLDAGPISGEIHASAAPHPSLGADPALEAALASLNPEHRAVIVLRFIAGYGPKETGEVLGIPTGTVGSRLRRALDQLRTRLEAEDG